VCAWVGKQIGTHKWLWYDQGSARACPSARMLIHVCSYALYVRQRKEERGTERKRTIARARQGERRMEEKKEMGEE